MSENSTTLKKKELLKEDFIEFLETTTAHGFVKIILFKHKRLIIAFWLFVIILSIVAFGYHLYILSLRYIGVPLSTKLTFTTFNQDFPSITICFDDPNYYVENSTNFVSFYNNTFKTVSDLITKFWINQYPNSSNQIKTLSLLSMIPFGMKSYGYTDPVLPVYKCLSADEANCDNLIKSSRFVANNKICGTIDIPENDKNKISHTFSLFYIWMSTSPYMFSVEWPNWNNFLTFYIHAKGNFPSGASYMVADFYGISLVNVQKTQVNTESTKKKPCINNPDNITTVNFDGSIRSFVYSSQLCVNIKIQYKLFNQCQCIASNLPIPVEFSKKLDEKLFCHHISQELLNNSTNIILLSNLQSKLNCYQSTINGLNEFCNPPCTTTIYYGNSHFYAIIPSVTAKNILLPELLAINDSYIRSYFVHPKCLSSAGCSSLLNFAIKLQINLNGEIKSSSEFASYNIVNLLSDVGGILGLYGGSGCLTIVEFLEFMAKSTARLF